MIYNKPKKILGCGDIHFFNSKRFEEHRHVLNNFYKLIDKEKPDLILIGGDVVDSKLRLSPEQIEMCRDFLMNLANTCPVIMIPGNHDVNLQNKDRLDSLTPFVNSLVNEVTYPIHYLKNSGLYELYGITWAVWSCIDDQLNPFTKTYTGKKPGEIVFGMYHGVVKGASTDDGMFLSGGVEVEEFKDCDIVMLSDIHKQQSFRNNEINYTGSLIQVAVNENPNGSCLSYTLNSLGGYDVHKKIVNNDYSTINMVIGEALSHTPLATQKIRLRFDTDKMTRVQAQEIAKKMKSEHNVAVNLVPIIKKKNNSVIKLDTVSEITSNNVNDYFKEFVKKAKDKLNITDVDGDLVKLMEYEKIFSKGEIKNFEQGDYFVYKVVMNNFLSFGPFNTVIELDKDGLLGILGANRSGKSSIIKAIQFALFYEIPNSATLTKMINKYNRDKVSSVEVYLTKDGKQYKVRRTLTPKKSGVDVSVGFWEVDITEKEIFNLTKESRPHTEEELKKYLGINETFEMLSVFSAQKKQVEFIDCKNAERLKLVNKFLGLQNFELKESNVLLTLKEKNAVLANIAKQFDKEVDLTSLNNDTKRYELLLKSEKHEESDYKGELDELEFNYKDIITAYNSNLRTSQRKIDEPTKLLQDIETLKSEEIELHKKIADNVKMIATLEVDSKKCLGDFCKKHPEILDVNEWKPDYANINEHRSNIAVIDHDIKRSEKQLSMTVCDNCGKDFSASDRKKVEDKVSNWKMDKSKEESSIAEYEKYNNLVKTNIKGYKDILGEIDKLKLKDNPRLTVCIKDITIEISSIQLEIAEFEKVKEAKMIVSLLSDKVNEYNTQKKEFSTKLSDTQVLIGTYNSKLKEIEFKVKAYNERIKVLMELENEIRLLKAYRKIVSKDGLPLYILNSKITEINEKVNLVVSQVFDFDIEFSIDDEKGELKIQFSYPDEPDGNDIGLASGSETFIINVCIKVGLSQISSLPKIDSFFIDEGYDSLDAEAIEKLPALFNMLTNYYKNVVTISHMETVKDMCSSQIRLEKKGKYTQCV